MIIEKNFTGSTGYNKKTESPCQKIGFIFNCVAITDLANAKVAISVVSKTGQTKSIIPPTLLLDLAEIAASNEGFVKVKKSGTYFYKGTIELSNYGSLDIGDGSIQIDLDSLLSTTICSLFAIDGASVSNIYIEYAPVYVGANQYKSIELKDAYAVAVPVSSASELQLGWKNGRNSIIAVEELDMITYENNEFCYYYEGVDAGVTVGGSVLPGSKSWYVIGCGMAVNAKILLTAIGNSYIMRNKVI